MSQLSRPLFPATLAVLRFIWTRKMAYVLLTMVVLVTVVWQIENWRGRQRWAAVSAMIHAAGDDLEWEPPIAAPVPDDQNATRHPVFTGAFKAKDDRFGYAIDFGQLLGEASAGIPVDVSAIASEPPQEILAATAVFGEFVAGMHEAFQRPYCFWFTRDPGLGQSPSSFPLPTMGSMTSHAPRIFEIGAVRVAAHLALDDPGSAARETVALIKFVRSAGCGTGFGILVETALLGMILPDVAEIIAMPGWDGAGLAAISAALEVSQLLDRTDRWLRNERAARVRIGLEDAEHRLRPEFELGVDSLESLCVRLLIPYLPRGWHYQNLATLALWWEEGGFAYYDPGSGRVHPGPHPEPRKNGLTPYSLISVRPVSHPNFHSLYRHVGKIQAESKLCQVLCAVECYRLEHGQWPEELAQLVPDFIDELPRDAVTGVAPSYTHDESGTLTLASFDWDRTADSHRYAATVSVSAKAPAQPLASSTGAGGN